MYNRATDNCRTCYWKFNGDATKSTKVIEVTVSSCELKEFIVMTRKLVESKCILILMSY